MCSIERRSQRKNEFSFFCNVFSFPWAFALAEDFYFDFSVSYLYVS